MNVGCSPRAATAVHTHTHTHTQTERLKNKLVSLLEFVADSTSSVDGLRIIHQPTNAETEVQRETASQQRDGGISESSNREREKAFWARRL